LVKTSFSLYSHFFFKLVAIVAIFQLAPSLLSDFAKYIFPGKAFIHFFFNIIFQISTFIVSFVIIREVSEICLGGSTPLSKIIARISIRELRRFIGTELLAVIIFFMIVIGPTLIGLIIQIIMNHDTMTSLWTGAIIGFILMIFILLRLIFVGQVIVIERKYWLDALKRSVGITNTHFWKIFCYSLMTIIPFLLIVGVPLFFALRNVEDNTFVVLIIDIILSIIAIFISPISDIFITLFYYSLRIENDDFTKEDIVDTGPCEAV
jgi:hypothetical protein